MANNFANTTGPFSAILLALSVLPVVVGVFLAAPLVSRELDSGTYRFAFTQSANRTRRVLGALLLLALFVAAGAVVLGLLLSTWVHPFDVLGDKSRWQSGRFDTTWVMLAAWSLLGLAVGTLVGTLAKRTVAAMAGTAVVIGGFVVAATVSFVQFVVSIAPAASKGFAPKGLGVGILGLQSHYGQGPPGAWLLRSWMTVPTAGS